MFVLVNQQNDSDFNLGHNWKTVLAEREFSHSKPNVINKIHIYNKYTVRNSSLQYECCVYQRSA